jgi:hypothetical protein
MSAKKLDVELAECVGELKPFVNAKGESVPQFSFKLGNDTFDVFAMEKFSPVVGRFYYPEVYVRVKALTSKRTGNPYVSKVCAVRWHEVK